MKKSLLILICSLFMLHGLQAQTTKIYIVRHGEKSIENPADHNPCLSIDGKQRALSLAERLKKEKIVAIFTTDYKRTQQTVAPLAEAGKITIQTYNPDDPKALAVLINTNYTGKTVIIAGHSNTVLELTEVFAAKRPLKLLTDNDYDNLFLVTVKGGIAKASVEKFGKAHHAAN